MVSSKDVELTWTRLDTSFQPSKGGKSPLARSSHGVSLVTSDKLFVYGGEHVARTPLEETKENGKQCYGWFGDLSAKTWKDLEGEAPPPRIAHAQTVHHATQTVYIFGGRQGIKMEEKALNDLWVWDGQTESWTEIVASGDIPEARSFHAMICVGDCLYMFGGCGQTSGRMNDLYEFNIKTKTWKRLGASSLLKGRGGPNLIALEGGKKLAVVAGFSGQETKDGHVFDLASQTWDSELMKGLDSLRPRSVCISASFPSVGVAVVFGGEVDPSERGHEGAGGFTNDLVLLGGTSGALIETIPAGEGWPGPRGWADGGFFDDDSNQTGYLYVFGGLAGDDKAPLRLSDLWQLKISRKG